LLPPWSLFLAISNQPLAISKKKANLTVHAMVFGAFAQYCGVWIKQKSGRFYAHCLTAGF